MEKINVAELLKNCPKGMELYSPLCGDCKLYDVNAYGIRIETSNKDTLISLYHDGRYRVDGEIMLFPKGKTTWEGFQRPFKDGDVIFTHANCLKVGLGNTWISIYQENRNGGVATYVDYAEDGSDYYSDIDGDKAFLCMENDILRQRLATEEEKAKLFKAIKDNGYRWNEETKTLEKLVEPKFKVGDRIKRKGDTRLTTIKDIRDDYYIITILDLFNNAYITDKLLFINQNEYEIVPNKFDINTLKPFDKVLVRGGAGQKWTHDFFGFMDKDKGFPFVCVGHYIIQCIPYEGNEHLLGTTNDCDKYFKTWE